MATQQPTPVPNITPPPEDVPNRQNPTNFSVEMDAFLAWLANFYSQNEVFADWIKSTGDITYQNALEALTYALNSADSAAQSEAALDLAKQAVNLKGYWSNQTGSATKPYSVIHNDGLWLLVNDLADVTTSEPSTTNSDWFLAFKRATDLDVEAGSDFSFADTNKVKNKLVQREWSDLTLGKNYNESCFYRAKEYVVRNPIADDQVNVAPPPSAGRTYHNFDGSGCVLTANVIVSGDITFWYSLNNPKIPSDSFLTDLLGFNMYLTSTGTVRIVTGGNITVKIDGKQYLDGDPYPKDTLFHFVEISGLNGNELRSIAARRDGNIMHRGVVLNFKNIDQGEQIHEYELQNDAVDTLGGNLVKDPEFTNPDNFTLGTGWYLTGSKANGSAGTQSSLNAPIDESIAAGETFRIVADATVGAGALDILNTEIPSISSTGVIDEIVVPDTSLNNLEIQKSSAFSGDLSFLRVIKMYELSPSADFSDASGFTLVGGVTIDTARKVAVFPSGGSATKRIDFPIADLELGKRYRVKYEIINYVSGSVSFQIFDGGTEDGASNFGNGVYEDDIEVTNVGSRLVGLFTSDNFDGEINYFTITEVTDGTENGTIGKNFDRYWQLTNGEQSIEKSVGTLEFNDIPQVLTGTSYKIAPLSTANLRDRIVVSRAGELEPLIELDADDIAAGRRITHPNSQPDTEITLDSNDKITLEFNGQDLEVYRG